MSTTDDSTDSSGRRVIPDDDPGAATKDPTAKPHPAASKAAASKGGKDPEQLAADIEKTREELAETLDAIAEKVSPKRVAKRTTKKVTDAVKDTASSAKDKVSGAGKGDESWAPDPGPVSNVVPDLPPAAGVEVPSLQTTAYVAPQVTTAPTGAMSTYSTAPRIKPEYVAAGIAAGLLAWLLVRKRRG